MFFANNFRSSFMFVVLIILGFALCAAAQTQTETLILKPGFNFIAFKTAAGMKPADFKKLDPKIENIFTYDAKIMTFFSHNDGDPFDVTRGKGYIIKLNSQTDVTLSLPVSAAAAIGDIKLYKGFNLIGFSNVPGGQTFKSLMENFPSIISMHRWDPALRSFVAVARNGSNVELIDGLNPTLAAGETYFVKMSAETTINYDGNAILLGGAATEAKLLAFTPENGTFTAAQQIAITCSTPGATIKYTTDGTLPSASNGLTYSAPFTVSSTTTVNAVAIINGVQDPKIYSATYTFASTDFRISGVTAQKDSQGNYAVSWTTSAPTAIAARVIVMANVLPHPGNDKYFKETITASSTSHSLTIPAGSVATAFDRIRVSYVFSEDGGTYSDVGFSEIKF